MKIAYNLLQGLAAHEGDLHDEAIKFNVIWAYKVADEVLKQGGYDEAKTKNEELRKLEQRVAESEFKARLARGNKEGMGINSVVPNNTLNQNVNMIIGGYNDDN